MTTKTIIPPEIERLWKLGFGIHWLKPKSKVPLNAGWTKGPRLELEELSRTFHRGFNYGVRLGRPSRIAGAFLAVLDVDVKGDDPRYQNEAKAALFALFPEVEKGPYLLSGRGNGSAHYYVRVAEPVAGDETKARSSELVKVHMPSVPPSKREAAELTDAEVAAGVRLRPAWEISLLCEGRQAAVVGSIHPDTGKVYAWGKAVNGSGKDIPLLKAEKLTPKRLELPAVLAAENAATVFSVVDVSTLPLTDDQRAALVDGTGVIDRSAKVFELCLTLTGASVPDDVIVSVMTDRTLYLGNCAFDHAQSKDRRRAARWLDKYCLRPAKAKTDAGFDYEELPAPKSEAQLKAEKAKRNELRPSRGKETERIWPVGVGSEEWESALELRFVGANKPPIVKATLANILSILTHRLPRPDFVRLETFAQKVAWTCDTPWGTEAGAQRSAGNEDTVRIKEWFAREYKIEPSNSVIEEALLFTTLHNQHNAVVDYLDTLEWDGVERVDGAFARYLGARMPEPYLSAVTRKFFAACVKRIYQPGFKFDHVVVLEGKQGVGKSTFGSMLVGEKWFLDGLPNFQDKDAALNLVGAWVCELGELATLYRSEENAAKGFITRSIDKIRPPYGQRWIEYRRSTVFLGTTDKRDYLTDSAGNRRYWPVKVAQCDFAALAKDRDQLWAEAVWRHYFAPETLYLGGEAKAQAEAIQEMRRIEDEGDAMRDRFEAWLNDQAKEVVSVKMSDLFNGGPFTVMQETRINKVRAGAVLREKGFEKTHSRGGKLWVTKKDGSRVP